MTDIDWDMHDQDIAHERADVIREEPRVNVIQQKIGPCDGDEHVFIHVACVEGVDDVSIDIANDHGRRTLSVRVGGMGIGGHLLDRDITQGYGERGLKRFCPYCGEALVLVSSRSHTCDEE